MNKFAKLMCLLAILAVIGTSCKKNEETVTCTATFPEMVVEDGAKSYLVGNRLQWESSDNVVIFNTDNRNEVLEGIYKPTGAGNTVNLTPVNALENTNTLGTFYGFYPANVIGGGYQEYSATGDGEHITARFLLPKVQQYRAINGKPVIPTNAFACAARDDAASTLGNVHFNMRPICGVLNLRFYTQTPGKKVSYIEVTDKHFNTTGYVDMYIDMINPDELTEWLANFSFDESYLAQLTAYKESIGYYIPDYPANNPDLGPTVTLNCGGVPLSNNMNAPTDFYVALRPLACFSGMVVKVYFTDGTYANAINSTYNNKIQPNHIKVLPKVGINNFINQ